MIKFFAILNDDNFVVSQKRHDGNVFWYEQDGWQPSKNITDERRCFLYRVERDKVIETTKLEKVSQLKLSKIAQAKQLCESTIFDRYSQGIQNKSIIKSIRINNFLASKKEVPNELKAEIAGIEEAERWMGSITEQYQQHKIKLEKIESYQELCDYEITYNTRV